MKKITIPTIAFLIVLALNVTAIGVTPALTIIDYQPGEDYIAKFTVINTENKSIKAAILPEKETEWKIIDLRPLESRELTYLIRMPAELEPGVQTMNILIQELPTEPNSGTQIKAAPAVITKLQVKVPYNGKIIEADIGMKPLTENKIGFTIAVTNIGTEAIEDLNAEIKILNEKIQTESQELNPRTRTELKTEWNAPTQGKYEAQITINYDGKSQTLITEFDAGSKEGTYYKIQSEDPLKNRNLTIRLALLLSLIIIANLYFYIHYKKKKS